MEEQKKNVKVRSRLQAQYNVDAYEGKTGFEASLHVAMYGLRNDFKKYEKMTPFWTSTQIQVLIDLANSQNKVIFLDIDAMPPFILHTLDTFRSMHPKISGLRALLVWSEYVVGKEIRCEFPEVRSYSRNDDCPFCIIVPLGGDLTLSVNDKVYCRESEPKDLVLKDKCFLMRGDFQYAVKSATCEWYLLLKYDVADESGSCSEDSKKKVMKKNPKSTPTNEDILHLSSASSHSSVSSSAVSPGAKRVVPAVIPPRVPEPEWTFPPAVPELVLSRDSYSGTIPPKYYTMSGRSANYTAAPLVIPLRSYFNTNLLCDDSVRQHLCEPTAHPQPPAALQPAPAGHPLASAAHPPPPAASGASAPAIQGATAPAGLHGSLLHKLDSQHEHHRADYIDIKNVDMVRSVSAAAADQAAGARRLEKGLHSMLVRVADDAFSTESDLDLAPAVREQDVEGAKVLPMQSADTEEQIVGATPGSDNQSYAAAVIQFAGTLWNFVTGRE